MQSQSLLERALFPSIVALGLAFGLAIFVDARLAPDRLRESARSHGLATAELTIREIMCTNCRAEMKHAMTETRGVTGLETTRRGMTVAYDPAVVTPERLVGVITDLGYHAALLRSDT